MFGVEIIQKLLELPLVKSSSSNEPMACLNFKDFAHRFCRWTIQWKIAILSLIFFSFKADFKRPTNPMPVPYMARAPSVTIPHKVDRSKPNLSKALRTSEKILAPVVIFFVHYSDRSSSVSFNSLSTPFINITDSPASFTSMLSSIAKLHDTKFFFLSLRVSQISPASSSMRLAIVKRDKLIFSNSCTILGHISSATSIRHLFTKSPSEYDFIVWSLLRAIKWCRIFEKKALLFLTSGR